MPATQPIRRPFAAAVACARAQFARRGVRRGLRVLAWLLLTAYFLFALLLLALRYVILPQIENYRGDIERALSAGLHQSVSIRHIETGWQGLRPSLTLVGFELKDAAGRPALLLEHVEADLGWSSLLHLAPRLDRLEIVAPEVVVRRDPGGKFFIAGLEIDTTPGADEGFIDWLLAQDRVVVRDAIVSWHDERRGAPPLHLSHVNLDLRSNGSHHRFGLVVEPPHGLASRIDLRGDFTSKEPRKLDAWNGEAWVELQQVDIAALRTWVDYPVDLPQGSGGVRLWLGVGAGELTSMTADIRLADVRLRLEKDAPLLELQRFEGRVSGKRFATGYEAEAKQLTLQLNDGVRIEPMDFRLHWEAPAANRVARGEFSADGLDLATLRDLATRLPLDPQVRQKLATWAPRGRVHDLAASWTGEAGALRSWKVKGSFDKLGLAAVGQYPGFSGLSGTVTGDEKGGTLQLDSHDVVVDMPAVFAEPRMPFDTLSARTSWQAADGRIRVDIKKAEFQNRDAAGVLSGTYRTAPAGSANDAGGAAGAGAPGDAAGPGEIDITAELKRAAGSAVGRYIPLAVGQDVREWLNTAIVGGQASESKLTLKGDLARFPFADGKDGIFQVKGRFRGAVLRFANSWPEIRNVDGELLFDGARMLIKGSRGTMLGGNLAAVTAEIPDLLTMEEVLHVNGKASGTTAEFLKFIEASPVGEKIGHFTAPFAATGNGELDLKLVLPLRHLDKSRIEGRYRFAGNRLAVAADQPPLTDLSGEIRFTESGIEAQRARASLLGAPLLVDLVTADDGTVTIKAAGNLTVRDLRQTYDLPLFEYLSGSTSVAATLHIRQGNIDVRVESSLKGIASSLPVPFNKSATEARAFVFERKSLPASGGATRDQLQASYGDGAQAHIERRHDAGRTFIERGIIAIGTAPKLPERGVMLAAEVAHLDLDFWRGLLARPGPANSANGAAASAAAALGSPLNRVSLHANTFITNGRNLGDTHITAVRDRDLWQVDIGGDTLVGHVDWRGEGAGRLNGRLARLNIPDTAAQATPGSGDEPAELPALDLTVDHLVLRGKDLGEAKLQAENRDGFWAVQMDVKNDDGALHGQGRWRAHYSAPATQLDFKLEAKSIEKLLARLGYPQAVKRGRATLEGSLHWAGSPVTLDYPSLTGKLRLDAANGQFSKLEPGVGRLLGVMSLQSLPRRIALDFRDVFTEGFAFDSIVGESTVTRGIMKTDDLRITGPSANVSLVGSVNLANETQNLKVRVVPALGDTLTLGTLALVNPAAGAVTWLAQKLFKDPLGQVFAFEYAVTGSWADPKVEKLGSEKVAVEKGGMEKSAPAASTKESAKP